MLRLRLLILLPLMMAVILAGAAPAHAQEIVPNGAIPAGQVIDGDAVVYGQAVVVEGTVKGDLLAAGQDIRVTGTVEGSLIALGYGQSFLNGQIGGSAYVTGGSVELGPSARVGRNAYVGGQRLTMRSGSVVEGFLVATAVRGWISGEVGQQLRTAVGLLYVDGKVGGGTGGGRQ
jgi:cytoskeletal protein CcmA (bactofilin family)